jgi:hypothetical protein
MTSSIEPGWHDDPEDASAQRYWDGQAWTPHRRRKPLSGQSPAPPAAAAPPVPAAPAPSGFPPPPAPPTPQQPPSWTPPEVAAQYGQPPPGQWAPPIPQRPAVAAKAGGSATKVLFTVAAVVVVAVGVVLKVSGVLHRETKKLAVAEVQTEVQKILVDRVTGYTSSDITNVTCNNGKDPTVKQGGSFTCNVTDRAKQHQLTVTFTDGNGTYEVGLPQLSGGK